MKENKSLQLTLIAKFMQIVVACAAAEAIIFYVLSKTVIRGLMLFFFDTDKVANISMAQAGVAVIVVLLGTILSLISIILPQQVIRPMEIIVGAVNRLTAGILNLPEEMDILGNMSVPMRLLLTITLIVTVVIIVLPYAIAAVHFSYVVVRNFRAIEDRERAEREENERKRNLMLSDIAHDLRTPITTVAGYAQALDEGMISDDRRSEIYSAIRAKSARMSELIDLLFDYVKLDSDGFELHPESLDICELVRECAAFAYSDIEDAGMELDIGVPDGEIRINADRVQLSRVLNNLITNAVRHNGEGCRIGIYLSRDDDRTDIMICDNGELIDEEKAKHLFEPFVRGDESRSSSGGSGLGLSIAQKIVSMHGYRIRLVQRPDIIGYPPAASYAKMFLVSIPLKDR
ncbi:MAG: HAMP domain-containing histidine kinase [Lachnospiraceae bacterium]|nr:HAMP domain-containing histidine kinase [Lachnospiraceae bacterium]